GGVFVRRRPEVLEHGAAGRLDELGGGGRREIDRVRVAEHAAGEEPRVLHHLRFGMEPGARVVDVDVPVPVEAAVFTPSKLVEIRRSRPGGSAPAAPSDAVTRG